MQRPQWLVLSWADRLTGAQVLRPCMACRCCHGSRDTRCGVIGPALALRLEQLVEERGWRDAINVFTCSHIGGHKVQQHRPTRAHAGMLLSGLLGGGMHLMLWLHIG